MRIRPRANLRKAAGEAPADGHPVEALKVVHERAAVGAKVDIQLELAGAGAELRTERRMGVLPDAYQPIEPPEQELAAGLDVIRVVVALEADRLSGVAGQPV